MKTYSLFILALVLAIAIPASAQEKSSTDWDAAYEKIMSNPKARAEIEAKGASKEEVIAWLKEKGDKSEYADKEMASEKDVDWDAAYEKLLKTRPEIARKVKSGGATKDDVIAWMKNGGDKAAKGKGYNGQKVQVKDPSGFKQEGEKAVFSGPQPGEKLPAFKVIGLHGKRKSQEYDPVQVADGKPMVLIFQDNQVPGQKGLLLNGAVFTEIAKRSPKGLDVFSVFLVDDPTPESVFEYDFKDRIPPVIQISISTDRRDGPGSYGLNRNLGMTVIVARDGKVLHNFPMGQPMLYPNAYVLGAIAEAIDVKRETMAAWLNDGKNTKGDMIAMNQKGMQKTTEDKPSDEAMKMQRRRKAERATDVPRRARTLEVKDPAAFAQSQDKPIFSGPQPGEKLPTFKATSLLADNKGAAIDIIKDAGGAPQVIFFQDRSGVAVRGLFGVSDAINKIKQEHKNLRTSVVFLDDDSEFINGFAGRFAGSLKDRGVNHLGLSDDGRDGPGNYGLNRTISQTIILAKDGKVTRNFVFPQGLLYADPHVLGGIAELVGADREAIAKIVNMPSERERDAMAALQRADKADPQSAAKARFREKIAELVRSGKIDRAEAGELWNAAFGEDDKKMNDRVRKKD